MRNRPPTAPAFTTWPDPVEPIQNLDDLRDWHEYRCAYCGYEAHILDTDHDHDTGIIRGYLCRGCNLLIGKIPTPVDYAPFWAWMTGTTPAERFGIREVYLRPQSGFPVFKVADSDDARAVFTLAGLDFDALPDRRRIDPTPEVRDAAAERVAALQQRSYASWRDERTDALARQADIVAQNLALSRG